MDNTIFAKSAGIIRARENKLMDSSRLDALVEAESFSECIGMLQDSKYATYVSMPSYEEGLKIALEDLYNDMYKITPLKSVVDLPAARYDGHNIKCIIKGELTNTDISELLIDSGTIPARSLRIMIKEKDLNKIPKTLKYAIINAIESYEKSKNPQDIDIEIDKGIFQYMINIAEDNEIEYLKKFTKTFIDVINIKTFIRIKSQNKNVEYFKRLFLKGGYFDFDIFESFINDPLEKFADKIFYTSYYKWAEEGIGKYIETLNLGDIEKFGDNFIMDYLREAKYVSMGPEIIIAYIFAVENEIKSVRIILTGKKNRINPDIIRERLREAYV